MAWKLSFLLLLYRRLEGCLDSYKLGTKALAPLMMEHLGSFRWLVDGAINALTSLAC